jgi:hypothetical protein
MAAIKFQHADINGKSGTGIWNTKFERYQLQNQATINKVSGVRFQVSGLKRQTAGYRSQTSEASDQRPF